MLDFFAGIIVVIASFWVGCLYTEWRSLRNTARYIDQFNTNAARHNTRKDQP